MRQVLIILLLFSAMPSTKAQQVTFNLFHENKADGFILYANNGEWYPVSISLDLETTNMSFTGGDKKIFVIPAKNGKFKIGELTIEKPDARYKLGYNYKYTMGDVTVNNYDKSFVYDLPFAKGKSFHLYQGYNGSLSHSGENAIDFTMPEGTEVLAAREGTVVEAVQNNKEGCPMKECEQYNNYVTILHADGTFANYSHIKHNGAKVKLGQSVKKGDVIALSGNTGWSSGPHLHFVCFTAAFGKRNSFETRFRINNGEVVSLKEGNTYTRNY
jgi:murein DD-endopeptidase MepM/ murein hydrolase activator NlpD